MGELLFSDLDSREGDQRYQGPVACIAIEQSLDRVLDYSIPGPLAGSLQVGQRVRVPLGRRDKLVFGYVVAFRSGSPLARLKPVHSIADRRVLLPGRLMELARWMSRYYCCALGAVIQSMVPSAVKKKIGLRFVPMVSLSRPVEEIQTFLERTAGRKRRAVLARLLTVGSGQSIELMRLAKEAGTTPATVRKLAGQGLISIHDEPDWEASTPQEGPAESQGPLFELNPDQNRVMERILPAIERGGFGVSLLYGVTGSGKTEIYLRLIRKVVDSGQQAIVLVPEIALTPQTAQRFTERFARVAILHSGLSAGARHRFWRQIAQGQADVVVGARSAVFAPVPRLGVIVVDEEHEASYKQDTAPRYHARDVAIKRAQIEDVPVILGSATPSLESWYHAGGQSAAARDGWQLLVLPRRVRNLPLPPVELVDMRTEARYRGGGVHVISRRLEQCLGATIAAGQQAILLLNRRGYSSFVFCRSCGHVVQCRYCDATMTYHRSADFPACRGRFQESLHTGQLHCHYCLAVNPLPGSCAECGKKLCLLGLGTQRVEEELRRKFPEIRFVRVDSDSMRRAADYELTLRQFARGEIHLLLGTQMIAKGLDYPRVTLVGVISGDTALALPDFRSAERTFQLITQVAGRAGRGDQPGQVIVQTFLPGDPTLAMAIRQDYAAFAWRELELRRQVGLPPFVRMVRIVLRNQELPRLHEQSRRVAEELRRAMQLLGRTASSGRPDSAEPVLLKGPMPCAVNRIAGYHRAQILLFCRSAGRLQAVLSEARLHGAFADSERVAVDVDPVSLL